MLHRYLAFDIETAKAIPGDVARWREHRPLGIACAATLASDAEQPQLWFSKTRDDKPAKEMTAQDAQALVEHLCAMAAKGYRIVTWNGLGFDFDILAEESRTAALCRDCVLNHVDMMFHVFCSLGYPVALDKAAQGMGVPGKQVGMTGADAPRLWAQGQHKQVLDYVGQDVRTTLQIAQAGDRCRQFAWITQKGSRKTLPLASGWLTVRKALLLPEPDTSWMSNRIPRQSFVGWLGQG